MQVWANRSFAYVTIPEMVIEMSRDNLVSNTFNGTDGMSLG